MKLEHLINPFSIKGDNPTIIISRTDNIGDVVLTLPLAHCLKRKFAESRLLFLGKGYLKPLIDSCENIDGFLDWDSLSKMSVNNMVKTIQEIKADAIIHVFPRSKIAKIAYKAKIPIRIGTSHRLYNLGWCNCKVNFTRKKSSEHEAQLNFHLLKPLGINEIPGLAELGLWYGLKYLSPSPLPPSGAILWDMDSTRFNLVLHPKTRGSAREWDLNNYLKLVDLLPKDKFKIFITGTLEEGKTMREQLPALMNNEHITDTTGKFDFTQLLAFLTKVDGIVAPSTGPLHIAAALGKVAIGLYPSIKPMDPQRWAPLGTKATFLTLDKNCSKCKKSLNCECINSITPEQVKDTLLKMVIALSA